MNFKNLMLFIVLGLMTFSSCKKDDTVNVVEENKAKLVGMTPKQYEKSIKKS